LTARQVKRILANASLGDADVTKWQATNNYQTRIAVEILVQNIRPGASQADAFATHMQEQDST